MLPCKWQLTSQPYSLDNGKRQGFILEAWGPPNASYPKGCRKRSEVVLSPRRGSETPSQAYAFLRSLEGQQWSDLEWPAAPSVLPSCCAALQLLAHQPSDLDEDWIPQSYSCLMDLDSYAWSAQKAIFSLSPYIKVKIGRYPLAQEQAGVAHWAEAVHTQGGHLRLDANGGLTLKESQSWVGFLENRPGIAFLEQPLPPQQEANLWALAKDTSVRLSLDESLGPPNGLERALESSWPGLFSIKPALLGFPFDLLKDPALAPRVVLSCALETTWGLSAWLRLARPFPLNWPVGLMPIFFTPQGEGVDWYSHPEGLFALNNVCPKL